MPKFAVINPAAAEPSAVLGWYDTDLIAYLQMPPSEHLIAVPDDVWVNRLQRRLAVQGGVFVELAPPPAPPPAPRYVPLSVIRDRVTAAGKWQAFAAALDTLSAEQRWHLLTLSEGVAPDDPAAIALLTAIGCDPTEVLAP